MIPDKETRDNWRELNKDCMLCALGEYVPEQFFILLDAVDELEKENSKLKRELNWAFSNPEMLTVPYFRHEEDAEVIGK